MEPLTLISVITAAASVLICVLIIRRVKSRLKEMLDALEDIRTGNGNRRILSAADELTAPIAYEINEIVSSYEKKLSAFRRTDEANRQLMTSLSHDVRTPLTTLIGYLDAAHRGLVTGGEKDGKPALHAAVLRAYRTKCPAAVINCRCGAFIVPGHAGPEQEFSFIGIRPYLMLRSAPHPSWRSWFFPSCPCPGRQPLPCRQGSEHPQRG